jgi:hypothetical protein
MPEDGYFLSGRNALATVDQQEVEGIALRLRARPAMQKARGLIAYLWREVMEHPAHEQMPDFEGMLDEYLFHHALRAAASDAAAPRIARFMAPPHRWFGRDVPGSRWAGDSPDFIYRAIPVGCGARYEIRGRPTCEQPPTANYALMSDNSAAPTILGLLDSLNIKTESNGEFVISVDDTPAAGRINHLQTQPGAYQIWVRDALGDWETQSANALTIRRLDPPAAPALSEDQLAERAVRHASDGCYYAYYCMRATTALAPNDMKEPASSGPMGGMATQRTCRANVCLSDDEAMIITTTAGGARFRNAVLQNVFMLSYDYWMKTTSLNMTQMASDADGRFTYVISHQDPGVHNWLDTGGRRQTIFGQRWQAFPADYQGAPPSVTARVVKWQDLDRALPAGIRRLDAASRREQLARREAGFRRRFIDA